MIEVLQDWEEIGQATKLLGRLELPKHTSGEKCWDLHLLHTLVEPLARDAKIVDLGCSGVCTLKFLHAMGFGNLHGVDLNIRLTDRISQVGRMVRERTIRRPFRLYKKDLTDTRLAKGTYDVATCVSVIEHGVDFEKFLRESSRILKPSGLLFVTADYWQDEIDLSDDSGEFGLSWKILSRKDIEEIIALARRFGFEPLSGADIPICHRKCIVWHKREFTFIAMAFKKTVQLQ